MFFLRTDSMLYVEVFPYCSMPARVHHNCAFAVPSSLMIHNARAAARRHTTAAETPGDNTVLQSMRMLSQPTGAVSGRIALFSRWQGRMMVLIPTPLNWLSGGTGKLWLMVCPAASGNWETA